MNLKKILGYFLQYTIGLLPIKNNRIFCETGTGQVKDHPKAFCDFLEANNITKYDIIWAVSKNTVNSTGKYKFVYHRTLRYYYYLLTSKYWLRTHSNRTIVNKRKNQIYIQTWHGPGAIKREGYDMPGMVRKNETMPHARDWDYYIATDQISHDYIKTALNLNIPRILLGSMRSDNLVNKKYNKDELRKKFGISTDKKVVLYAPTFRDDTLDKDKIEVPIKKLLEIDNIALILRVHPQVRDKIDMTEYPGAIDGNVFPDIYDLYRVSDIIVVDYSSVAIEGALFDKPLLFYMYDLDSYMADRNFYYDYLDHIGGPMIKTEEELVSAIKNIDKVEEKYYSKFLDYKNRFNNLNDGHVCERFYYLLNNGFFDKRGNELEVLPPPPLNIKNRQ